MANTVAIPPPPRLTGNSQDDLTVLVNFLWEWYRAIVQQGAFVQNTDIGGSVQPQDATLTALADLPTAADLLPYFTGQDVAALTAFTAYARTLIAAATAGSARTTLGLGSLATKNSIATGNIDNDAVTNDKLAQMATMTVKGNDTAGTADPQDLTKAELLTLLGITELTDGSESTLHSHPFVFKSPASITLNAGTGTGSVTDIQTMLDGNVYHIDEAAGTPGFDLEINFTGVTRLRGVQVRCHYTGTAAHVVHIELRDYNAAAWDQIDTIQGDIGNHQVRLFLLPDDTNYIDGSGNTAIRIYHASAGNAAHDMDIDFAGLLT